MPDATLEIVLYALGFVALGMAVLFFAEHLIERRR